jgi:hypothetical protein
MDIVARGLTNLLPLALFVEVALFANSPIQVRMRRDLLYVRCGPAPDDPDSILNILLMAGMAIDPFVGTFLPSLPGCFHDVAGGTKIRIVFDIVIKTVAADGNTDTQHDQDSDKNVAKTMQAPRSPFLRDSITVAL